VLETVLWFIYEANLSTYCSSDCDGAGFLPVALIRGDGLQLDRFERHALQDGRLTDLPKRYEWVRRGGHIRNLYPIAPAIMLTPLVWPQVWVLDGLKPGWENGEKYALYMRFMAKNGMAWVAACIGVALLRLLTALGLSSASALITSIAVGLGSNIWVITSQVPWQHGPAALVLTTAMALLSSRSRGALSFLCAGLMTGLLFAFRSTDLIFALPIR